MKKYVWFKSYDPGVPHTLQPYPEITVLDVLADCLKERPEHPLAIFKIREVSYREVEEHSNALAKALIANGLKKNDRVICLFLNCPQSFIAFFAIWKAGGIVVPLNPFYTSFELERSINDVEAEMAIAGSRIMRKSNLFSLTLSCAWSSLQTWIHTRSHQSRRKAIQSGWKKETSGGATS